MRYLVEKTDPYSEYPHLTDERHECESATEAGVRMEELCPMDYDDVRDTLWRGEDVRYCDDEGGAEVIVTRIEDPQNRGKRFHGKASELAAALATLARSGVYVLPPPTWLSQCRWAFPTWIPNRPFDWAFDDADVPIPPPPPLPAERRRLTIPLRAPAAVVQR